MEEERKNEIPYVNFVSPCGDYNVFERWVWTTKENPVCCMCPVSFVDDFRNLYVCKNPNQKQSGKSAAGKWNFRRSDGINSKIDDIKYLKINSKDFYFTHGNIYNCYSNDTFTDGVLVYGHEHKPYIKKDIDMIYVNPGSISLPRTEFGPSYGVINGNKITIYEVVSDKVLFTSGF